MEIMYEQYWIKIGEENSKELGGFLEKIIEEIYSSMLWVSGSGLP